MEVTKKDIKRVILTVDIEEDIKELEERIIAEPSNQKLKNELQELKKLLIKLRGLEQQNLESEGNVVDKVESEKPRGILNRLFGRKKGTPMEEFDAVLNDADNSWKNREMQEKESYLKQLGIERDSQGRIILYHATLAKNYAKIELEGSIKPPVDTGNRTWRLQGEEDSEKLKKIYLATKEKVEEIVVSVQNQYGGSAYILRVHVDEKNLRPDEDTKAENWYRSLDALKTCSFKGEIKDYEIFKKIDFQLPLKVKKRYFIKEVESETQEEKRKIRREFKELIAQTALEEEEEIKNIKNVVDNSESEKPIRILSKLFGRKKESRIEEISGNEMDNLVAGSLNPNNRGSAIARKLTNFKGDIFNKISGTFDVIIIGETHTDEYHSVKEAQLIEKYKPEYVLLEGLNNIDSEDERLKNIVKQYTVTTFKEISNVAKITLEDMGITAELLSEVKNLEEEDGAIPKNFEQLVETPLYEFDSKLLSKLTDLIHDKIDLYISEGNHKLVRLLASVVKTIYSFKESKINNLHSMRIFRATAKVDGKLAGCDIKKEDRPLLKFDEKLSEAEKIKNVIEYQEKLDKYVSEKNSIREEIMGEKILKYVRLRTTNNPIIAIVGKEHTRKKSGIYLVLDKSKIKYKIIKLKEIDKNKIKRAAYSFELGMK